MAIVARVAALQTERYMVGGMTCGSCVRHIQKALRAVPGVATVRVDLGAGTAVVDRNPAAAPVEQLVEAVAEAGYELRAAASAESEAAPRARVIRPAVFGTLASAGLFALYLGIVTVAQGWGHATDLLAEDLGFILPIMLGFGTQVGLYSYLRALRASAASGGMAASTGTSTGAMLACCAHHLVDVLPVVGLSGAALFLGAYKAQLLWLGLAMNLAGIAYLLWQLRRWRTRACCP